MGLGDLGRSPNQKAYGDYVGLGQDSDVSLPVSNLPIWPRSDHDEFAGVTVDRTCLLPRCRNGKPLSGEKGFVSLYAGSSPKNVSVGFSESQDKLATRLLTEVGCWKLHLNRRARMMRLKTLYQMPFQPISKDESVSIIFARKRRSC